MAIGIKQWATVVGGDSTASTSRFPVLYWADFLDEATCRCGCGETGTGGDWSQGHDQWAVHDLIRADFGGSVSRFIDWYEANGPFAAADQEALTGEGALA